MLAVVKTSKPHAVLYLRSPHPLEKLNSTVVFNLLKELTATHLGGGVAAGRADLLLLVKRGATAPPAGRVGLGMPLTERSRTFRLSNKELTGEGVESRQDDRRGRESAGHHAWQHFTFCDEG